MSKGTTFQNDFLKLIFYGTAIDDLAINDGSSPAADLYLSFHTASPAGAAQTTNECAYTGYARVLRARNSGAWTITGNVVSLAAIASFPACVGGSETATHVGIGMAPSGAGKLLWWGTLSPVVVIFSGIIPKLGTGTQLTED